MPENPGPEETVFEALQDLSHSDLVYFFGDLCAVNGWDPHVAIGDEDTTGDLIATRTIPHPESIAFVNFDGGAPSVSDIEGLVDDVNTDRVTILLHESPGDDLLDRQRNEPFSFLGMGDLTAEVSRMPVIAYLREYFSEGSDTYEKLGRLMTKERTQASESIENEASETELNSAETNEQTADEDDDDDQPDTEVPVQELEAKYDQGISRNTIGDGQIGSSGPIFGVIYLGCKLVSIQEETGVLCAFEVFAEDYDLEIRPDQFKLFNRDGYSFVGRSSYDSKIVDTLSTKLDEPWNFGMGSVKIPAGGKIKKLIFFQTGNSGSVSGIRYSAKHARLFSMNKSQIEDMTGLGRYDLTSLDLEISESRPLPEPVEKELNALGNQEDDEPIQESVLSPDDLGIDMGLWDVVVESWGYYDASDAEWNSRELRSGLFVSIEVTPKRNNKCFRSNFLRLRDTNGYEHVANGDSEVMNGMDWENLLQSPWRWDYEGSVDLPDMGSRIKILQHVQCQKPLDVSELVISAGGVTVDVQVDDRTWADLRGLPDHIDTGLQSLGMRRV